jgi:hypothetical protein
MSYWGEVMSRQKTSSSTIFCWPAVSSLAFLMLVADPLASQSSPSTYIFLVAAGNLCDSGGSSACPAVVKSERGDSYEMSGAGMLETQNKSVHAAGTFTHRAPGGSVLDTGVWIATQLVSFDSYGISRSALHPNGAEPRLRSSGPQHSPMFSGPVPNGGLAVFHVRLVPISGTSKAAVLQVNCASGNVPDGRSVEGIRLNIESNGGDFSEEAGGRVVFLATWPKVPSPARTPGEETTLESAQPQHN